jgi:hypothetical protein
MNTGKTSGLIIKWLFGIFAFVIFILALDAVFPLGIRESWERLHPFWVDWSEHGIDPNSPNFKPEVLFLAGKVESSGRTYYFEITMRGRDQYFRRTWIGREGKLGAGWGVELILGEFSGHYGFGYRRGSAGGGGGSNNFSGVPADEIPLCVAQDLWDSTGFVGAAEENQTLKDKWGHTEVFQKLEQRGKFKIPRKISFTTNHGTLYGGEQTSVYIVKRIEFRNEPTTDWFEQMKQKYFR